MIVILSITLGILAYYGSKQIRKYFSLLLGLSVVVSIGSLVLDSEMTEIITQGFIGLAFYVIVMFAGSFKRNSNISKRLRSVRKEYSIIGFILLIPHGLIYVIDFLDGSYPVEWFGIIAMVVMLPLFIISFGLIKKKMPIRMWVNIQKWAYLGYALIFIHLIIVSEGANQISYGIVFGIYSILKLINYAFSKNKSTSRSIPRVLKASVVVVLIIGGLSVLDIEGFSIFDIDGSSIEGIELTEVSLEDGIYTGTTTGFKNLITELEVTIENGVITEIVMTECGCTAPHQGTDYEAAAMDMIKDIINEQSTNLDSMAGATKTTDSILKAVEEVVEKSKIT